MRLNVIVMGAILCGIAARPAPSLAFKIDPWSYPSAPGAQAEAPPTLERLFANPQMLMLGPISILTQVPANLAQLSEAVHENLTELSLRCAKAHSSTSVITQCAGLRDAATGVLKRGAPDLSSDEIALIRAVRWSDAPPMRAGSFLSPANLLCGEVRVPENAACWALIMASGAAAEQETPIDDRAHQARLANLLLRSHYGDLQFMHAMAGRGETPHRTQERVLKWAQFTYQVANGEILTDASIAALDKALRDDVLLGFEDRTVTELFETARGVSAAQIRRVALGALLHLLQDSYARGHATRSLDASGTAFGALVSFNDYNCQSPARHAAADRAETNEWFFATEHGGASPVTRGAQLIAWVNAGVPWQGKVQKWLADEAFSLAPAAKALAATAGSGFERGAKESPAPARCAQTE